MGNTLRKFVVLIGHALLKPHTKENSENFVFLVFQEDGETYMLVPKRKNRPPGVDRWTQTEIISREDSTGGSRSEASALEGSNGSRREEEAPGDRDDVQIRVNDQEWMCDRGQGVDNPVVVAESI